MSHRLFRWILVLVTGVIVVGGGGCGNAPTTNSGPANTPTAARGANNAGTATVQPSASLTPSTTPAPTGKTVFLIMMENHNWSDIKGSPSAPYINNTLLPMASHAEQYYNPPGVHPSEPNYLWLEAGTNFGILDDNEPAVNHQSTTQHLATFLQNKNISWKSYQENIDGTTCPLVSSGLYATKHNPFVFFDDVTNNLNANSANCIAHIRPFTEITNDLATGNVAQYNFITPNL